ncbi:MAG: type II secretion system protein GspG, partial [Polyangiaceae bacterium]
MTRLKKQRQGGFSLIELMVVISIIGLLAGIVALNVGKAGVTAKKKKVIADCSTFDKAISMYKIDVGTYPQQLTDLIQGGGANWNGPYIENGQKALLDPWGNEYIYQYTGNGDPP